MSYVIVSNGSKWAGQAPDSLDKLAKMLKTHKLLPWSYSWTDRTGCIHIQGNFETYSHVFNIEFYDPALARKFRRLMYQNKKLLEA